MISRIRIAKRAVAALAALTFAVVAPLQALAQQADPYAFEKKAYKPDGTPWTGPVNVGDTVKYVLSYKPGATGSGPATIDDTLSPNQTYVAPTTSSPGWTWGSSPYATGNHEQYKHPGFGPGTGSVALTVKGNPKLSKGFGDGTIPIPFAAPINKVFGIFHHSASARVGCWDLTTLAPCSGAPVSSGVGTPMTPKAVIRGTKFYFAGVGSGGKTTIACFDAASNSACSPVVLSETIPDLGAVAGVVEDSAGRILLAANNKVFCRTESGGILAPCSGWPAGGMTTSVTSTPITDSSNGWNVPSLNNSNIVTSGQRAYIHHGTSIVQCIDTTNGSICTGGTWNGAGVTIPSPSGGTPAFASALLHIPTSATGDGGVCLVTHSPSILVGCLDPVGSSNTSTVGFPLNGGGILSGFQIPGSSMVLIPNHASGTPPVTCADFAGGSASSCGWTQPATPFDGWTYGFAMDPSKEPNCVLALGDQNLLWRFDYKTGIVGCGEAVSTPPVDLAYCNGAPDPAKFRWSSVTVGTPGAAGTLTIKQGTTTATLTLISGTTNYAMPASIVAGTGPLTFTYTPTSGPASVDIQVGYTSDKNPEICYQAKVSKCGPVFNDAVFKAAMNGAPVSTSRKVDLGIAIGPECDVPPAVSCLSGKAEVACGKAPGTYVITLKTQGTGGVTPDVVSITPKTAGVTILNPQVSYPVINGEVKITVAGANPGDTLEFDMEGTVIGAGSVEGSDLCCNGTIKVDIPKDLPCEKPTVDVTKVCEPATYRKYALGQAVDAIGWVSTCTITVTTTGPQSGTLSVTDQLNGGGTLLGVNSTTTPPWTCGPTGCSINGNLLNQTASTSVFSAQVAFTTKGGALEARNCASVYGRQKPLDRDCTKITVVDDPKEPDVTIAKVCEPARQLDSPVLQFGARCRITVTTTGPIQTHLVVSDTLSGNGQVTSFTNTSTPAWTCIPGQCDMEGSNLDQTSSVSTFDAFVTFPAGQGAELATARNCATLGFDAHPVGESCADIRAEDDRFKLVVTKDCSGVIALSANGPWAGSCTITVTATGGPRPPFIAISDVISDVNATRNPPVSMTNMVSADPWTCAAPSGAGGPLDCSIAGSAFPASGTSTIDIQVYVPIGVKSGEAKNCVKAAGASDAQTLSPSNPPVSTEQVCVPLPGGKDTPPPPTDGTISVTKTCDPAAPNGATNDWGGQSLPTIQAICHLTVTGSGNLPPVIELHEGLVSGAPAANSPMQINIAGMSSPQNWQFPSFPVAQGTTSGGATTPALATLSSADLLAAGGTSTIDVTVQFMNAGWASESQNCVQAFGVATPGAAPGAQSEKVCVPFTEVGATPTLPFYVRKEVVSHAELPLENLQFTFTSNCTGNATPPLTKTIADGGTEAFQPIPSGESCTISESPPGNTNACGNMVPRWTTQYFPSATIGDFTSGNTIVVRNTLDCDCPENQKPVNGVCSAQPVSAACDPATATNAGDLCRCRFNNMSPVSKTACECKDGFTLKAGQGCVRAVVTPECDPATTVTRGGKCVCEYKNMVQASATACACAKGFRFASGKGCVKPEPECRKGERFQPSRNRCEPVCGKGFDYSVKRNACIARQPECKKGTVFNAKTGKCVPVQPVCKKPFVYDPKRNACVEQVTKCKGGQIAVKGKCVSVPKCPPGTIPVPGTKACVTIGIGGDRGRGDCKPGPIPGRCG